jgi:uncharacterized protein (TIGR03083 family)
LFTPQITRVRLTDSLRDASNRFVGQLRSTASSQEPAIGDWTTGEVAAHVSHVTEIDCAIARGEGSPVEDHLMLGDSWARMLADDPERNPMELADRIEASGEVLADMLSADDLERVVEWHGGVPISVGALGAVLVNEYEVHGLDIARAIGRPWTYPRPHALLAIDGLLVLAPHYLDRERASDFRASYELRPRGGRPISLTFHDGEVSVGSKPTGRIDCRLTIDPVAYVLVAFGRRSTWEAIAKGQVIAWGRRPWLGFRFASMFIPT